MSETNHTDPLLDGLTEPQALAVRTTEGPLLVLAGPGSGKTRVITRRIAWLLRGGGGGTPVRPWNILAVTFTNKAAGEMRERVARLLGGHDEQGNPAPPRGLTIATFHSLCVRLLRRYADTSSLAEKGLLSGNFTVFDADDQQKLIKGVLKDLNFASQNFSPRSVLEQISAAKNQLIEAEAYSAQAGEFYTRCIARCYTGYQAALRKSNACDFDDLLLLTAKMLRETPAVLEECRRRYRYILVDEYQDTNGAQFQIARLLAGERGPGGTGQNLCVVGDPDQSIYAWRGADIANILEFEAHYPGAKVVRLEENFRSVSPVLLAAGRLIKRNSRRKHKELIATRAGGEAIQVVQCRDEHHEARLVVDWVRRLREEGLEGSDGGRRGIDWKDCAVFYRTNALSRVMEDAFRNAGIPYALVRGTAFYQREEVRDAVGYLRVAANFNDSVSHERIINKPSRGISDKTWEALAAQAAEGGVGVADLLRRPQEIAGVTARAQNAVAKYVEMIDGWARPATESFMGAEDVEPSLRELVEKVVRESGLELHYKEDDEKRENLAEFVSSAADFEQRLAAGEFADDAGVEGESEDGEAPAYIYPLSVKLAMFLERIALVADTDALNPASGSVTLMTLHAAKGLEFPVVAMIGLEEGTLPHVRGLEDPAGLEEERRLCFVGVTRAMDRLMITTAAFRTIRGQTERQVPSLFLDELKGEGVQFSDQGGGFGARRDSFDEADGPSPVDDLGEGRRIDRSEFAPSGGKKPAPFPVGAIVRHPQFGLGEVKSTTVGANARVKVNFKSGGEKVLILEFARLERVK